MNQDQINDIACKEGWSIFTCCGSANGPYQVQRLDSPDEGEGELATDEAAWLLVLRGHEPHHIAARDFIEKNGPQEWAAMNEFAAKINNGKLSEEDFK